MNNKEDNEYRLNLLKFTIIHINQIYDDMQLKISSSQYEKASMYDIMIFLLDIKISALIEMDEIFSSGTYSQKNENFDIIVNNNNKYDKVQNQLNKCKNLEEKILITHKKIINPIDNYSESYRGLSNPNYYSYS